MNRLTHKNCRLEYGTTRFVFLVDKFAIKIPSIKEWRLFLLGLLANMQEAQWSKIGWVELCPVLFSIPGGFLIVMHRARILNNEEFLLLDIEQWIEESGHNIPVEMKADSFGYLGRKLVAVDYGN